MKALLLVLVLSALSCTKNDIHKPIIISGNVKSVEAVVNFSYPAAPEYDLHATEKISYTHSPVVVYEIPSKTHAEKKLTLFSLNNKFLEAVSITTALAPSVTHWQLLSTDMREYYSFKVSSDNRISDFRVNDIPFYKLQVENPMLADAVPIDNAFDSTAKRISWTRCMNETVSQCSNSWGCSFACGFLLGQCGAGMALSCLGHWWESGQRR